MHSVGESGTNVPAFLAKLWKLVEDPALDDLISWNPSGLSFTIRDQARFARELLPLYYKHNNMASFVRQLNMYGFHKVVSLDSGGLKLDKDEMEFAHTYFIRGHECLLEHIKRKIPVSKQDEGKVKPEMLSKVLSDVRVMRGKQETLDTRLSTMKRENEALWREVASLRQKHLKQQQIVNKLIHFLISVVQPNGRSGISLKRRLPLMLQEETHSSSSEAKSAKKEQRVLNINLAKALGTDNTSPIIANISPGGPIIHDVTDLMEDMEEGPVVEVPVEQEITLESVPVEEEEEIPVTEVTEPATELDIHLPSEFLSEQPVLEILPDKPSDSDAAVFEDSHPDLSLVAQLEENETPLSPDLMLAVNPSEIVGKRSPIDDYATPSSSGIVVSGKFAGEAPKEKDNKKTNGKSPAKENEMTLALVENGQNLLGSRDELDNHLDTIQMDLESLREILSLQPNSVDPATLLGILTLGSEESRPDCLGICSSPPEFNFSALLDQHFSSKLFSAGEPTSLLNSITDAQRSALLSNGNELMSYNPSLFELTNDDGQFLLDDSSLLVTGLDEEDPSSEDKTDGLLGLLGLTDGPGPAKKTKSS